MPADRSTARERRWLAGIVAAGLVVRVLWVLHATRPPVGLLDQTYYLAYGQFIAKRIGYVIPFWGVATAYYPIGYPAVLGAVFWVLVHTPLPDDFLWAASWVNVVFGTATIALVFALARRAFTTRVALVAAALVALWPNLVIQTATPLTETVFNALLLGGLLVLLRGDWEARRLAWGRLAAAGLILWASVMVRPVSLMVFPVLAIVWLVDGWGWRRVVHHVAVLGAVGVVLWGPWAARNEARFHRFVPISTNTGDNLCMSRHPGAVGTLDLGPSCFPPIGSRSKSTFELWRNDRNTELAKEFVREHPVREVQLWFWRVWYTVHNDHDGVRAVESYGRDRWMSAAERLLARGVSDAWYYLALLLTAASVPFLALRRHPRRGVLVWTVPAIVIVPVVVFFGDVRFHVPALPLLAMTAAVGIVELAGRLSPRRGEPSRPRPSPSG
jgi:hypothetical protein